MSKLSNNSSQNLLKELNTHASHHTTTHTKLDTIATNTANIKLSTDSVNLNVDTLEALQGVTNAKLIEISGKQTDVDNSVKANALTITKLNQILTKNTEIDNVLDICSAKLTDVDDSVKANALTITKLNQILTKNTEIDNVLDICSAKLSDIDTTTATTATILRPYLIEGNGHLTTIKGDTTSLDGKVTACNTGAVVVSSSALPSGASTSAKQDHLSGDLDTANGHLTTIKGDTTSLDGKVTACNTGAVVVSSSALPSGASTSAKQDHLSGDLDTANGHLTEIEGAVETIETCIKAEDVAHTNGDTGIMALCVRQDTQADFGANGDYCPMSINADGELRVTTGSGSDTMSVDTIHTASVDAGADGTSSVFTKPKGVSTLGFTIKNTSSANGIYQIIMETSVDNSSGSFVGGSNFNGNADNRVNKSFASNELGFKFYRFRVTNGHVSAQAYKMQISY